ncbi:MAG TPA: BREX system P-loop protein BrxC [Smithellaceae bacterium]|nr:BREX system P-loop protein BrxC [Smithellaceae bacterium]
MHIGEIFETRITEKIEPVIKVGEVQDEKKLASEIGSFVVTPHIEEYTDTFLDHYTDTIRKQTTEIGVWISGYFGSGKSHLAKMLAQVTANRSLDGITATKRFNARVPSSADRKKSIERSLSLLSNCATTVLAFNLNTLTDSRSTPLPTLLLSQYYLSKGYSSNYIFAKVIEAGLDKLQKLDAFHQEVEKRSGKTWENIQTNPNFYRKHLYGAVCAIAPELFSTPDEVAEALRNAEKGEIFNIEFLIKTILTDIKDQEKASGKPARIFFVLDESGQWIEDQQGRLAQLQALAEEAAIAGQGKIWILVTTHEDMGSVYKNAHALDSDFKKIEGRFRFKFGLTTENIELVLEDRIFKKTLAGKKEVEAIYQDNAGVIRGLGELANVSQNLPQCSSENFVKFYPFFPYQIHLIPEIVKALRSKGGRSDSLSGSTRTLLAITQDVIRAGRRNYLQSPVREMVSFDEIYFNLLQEGEISADIRREISKIQSVVPAATDLTPKLAEVLFLTGELNYLPKSADNLARLLVAETSQDLATLQPLIEAELEKLKKAKIVARIGDEWEFLTGERRTFEEAVDTIAAQLKFQDREEGLNKLISTHILGFDTIPFKGHDFQARLYFDNKLLTKNGHVDIRIISPFGHYSGKTISDYENESLKPENNQTIYIFCDRVPQFSEQLDRYIAMDEVVTKWRSDPSKSGIEHELANSKATIDLPKLKGAVEGSIRQGLKQGHLIFRGSSRAIVCKTGQQAGEAVRTEIGHYFGTLYPKYDKLPIWIKSEQQDISDVLAGSKALSQDVKSLKLYDKTGQLDVHIPLIDEIRIYLTNRQNKKQRTLGQDILDCFETPPYGWDPNAVRIGIAAALRAGMIKIAVDKKIYTNPADTELSSTMRNSKAFNKAEVILEETDVDTAVLIAVRTLLIKLTGNRKIDETPSDITVAAVKYLHDVKKKGDDAQIWASAANFPLPDLFTAGMESIETLLSLTNPVQHVKEWEAKSATIEEELNEILAVHTFYGKHAEPFKGIREHYISLKSIQYKIPKDNVIHHFLKNYATAEQDKTIHKKDVWQTLQDNKASVLTEVEALKRTWRQAAKDSLAALKNDIEAAKATGVLSEQELSPFETTHQGMAAEIDEETDLIKIALLPDSISGRAKDMIARLEELIKGKEPGGGGGDGRKRVKKIKLFPSPKKIKSLIEWTGLKDELDAQISTALDQGDEVELS